MLYRKRLIALVLLLAAGNVAPAAFAQGAVQSAAETEEIAAPIAPTEAVTASDFGLPEPTTWQFFKRRVARFFTLREIKQLRVEAELATMKLLAAKQQLSQGDSAGAMKFLAEHDTDMTRISDRLTTLATSLNATSTNPDLTTLLARIQEDRLLQAGLAEQLSQSELSDVRQASLEARAAALRDVAKLLSTEQSEAALNTRLSAISAKLTQKETKTAQKATRKLSIIEELSDDVSDDLVDDLDEAEDETLDELAEESDETIGEVARLIEGSFAKHVLVLQALLDRVPAAAKPAVQAAVDRGLAELAATLSENAAALDELARSGRQPEAYAKVLEGLKKQTERAGEDVKRAVEQERERARDEVERARETEKQAAERTREQTSPETDEEQAEDNSSGSESAPAAEVQTKAVEVKFKEGKLEPSSIEVVRGTVLTVTFKNEAEETQTFYLGEQSTGALARGASRALRLSITVETPYGLSDGTARGTIRVK